MQKWSKYVEATIQGAQNKDQEQGGSTISRTGPSRVDVKLRSTEDRNKCQQIVHSG